MMFNFLGIELTLVVELLKSTLGTDLAGLQDGNQLNLIRMELPILV